MNKEKAVEVIFAANGKKLKDIIKQILINKAR